MWDFQKFFPKWLGEGSAGAIALSAIFDIIVWLSVLISFLLAAWSAVQHFKAKNEEDDREKEKLLKKARKNYISLIIAIFFPILCCIIFNIVDAIWSSSSNPVNLKLFIENDQFLDLKLWALSLIY